MESFPPTKTKRSICPMRLHLHRLNSPLPRLPTTTKAHGTSHLLRPSSLLPLAADEGTFRSRTTTRRQGDAHDTARHPRDPDQGVSVDVYQTQVHGARAPAARCQMSRTCQRKTRTNRKERMRA